MVTEVIDILIADTGVQNLVGRNKENDKYKVYPVVAPQKEQIPYVTVRLTGKAKAGKGCEYNYTVSVTSFCKNYDDVSALDDAVLAAMETDQKISLDSTSDNWIQADGNGIYTKTSTFSV
jgi:hypothetical protein